MRKIETLFLHCSATQEGKDYKAADINRWHKAQGWACIGYHYVIDLDGTIEKGRDIEEVGAHCKGYNSYSIAICYIGGLDENNKPKDTRTKQQKESLYKLVNELMIKFNIPLQKVYCHYQMNPKKACPCFRIEDFNREFKEYFSN